MLGFRGHCPELHASLCVDSKSDCHDPCSAAECLFLGPNKNALTKACLVIFDQAHERDLAGVSIGNHDVCQQFVLACVAKVLRDALEKLRNTAPKKLKDSVADNSILWTWAAT